MYPNTEMVDIVSEDDKVLFQVSKQEAHEKGLLHRTVIGRMTDSQGNWILVEQSGDRQDVGQFVCPVGGHVSSGESYVEALLREGREEIGQDSFEYQFVGKFVYNRDVLGRHENHYFIIYDICSDSPPVLNHESVSFRKFTSEELKKLLNESPEKFGPPFHAIIRQFYPGMYSL